MYWGFKKWIRLDIENPFKTMKKLKGVFIPLKRYFKFATDKKFYPPFIYCPKPEKIFIKSCDVDWKDKWNSPRYEEPPYIWIHLFKYNWVWYWRLPDSFGKPWIYTDDYWEQALWYLYYASYNRKKKGYDELDINKAREKWPLTDCETKQSSWNNKFLIK